MIILAYVAFFCGIGFSDNQVVNRLIAACVICLVSNIRHRLHYEMHHWLYLAWFIWAGIGVCCSDFPAMAFYGFMPYRGEGFLSWIVITCVAHVYWKSFNSIRVLAIACMVLCVAYVGVHFWWVDAPVKPEDSVYGECLLNVFVLPRVAVAAFASVAFPLSFIFHPGFGLMAVPLVLVNRSGSALLALFASFVLWQLYSTENRVRRIAIIWILLIQGLALSVWVLHTRPHLGLGARPQWIFQGETLASRLPPTGLGLDTLSNYLYTAKDAAGFPTESTIPDRIHNAAYDAILQTGWIGYTLLLLALGAAIGAVVKNPDSHNMTCLCVLIGWIIFGMFNPHGHLADCIALTCLFGVRQYRYYIAPDKFIGDGGIQVTTVSQPAKNIAEHNIAWKTYQRSIKNP